MKSQNADTNWSRRTFLSTVALTGAAAAAVKFMPGQPVQAASGNFLAFVGFSASGNSAEQRIESYRVADGKWTPTAMPFAAENPHALAVHPTLPILYVTHSTDLYKNLPRGSVSALGIDLSSGSLAHQGREGLALSATQPDHLSISPDGSKLLVSSNGGGSYNLFRLAADGAVVPTPRPLKETGFGPNPEQESSHPHTVLFNAAGTSAYASDLGTDRISQIALHDDAPAIQSRASLEPGSGPAAMVLHPSEKLLVVISRLKAGLTVVSVDSTTGELLAAVDHVSLGAGIGGPVALSESGNRVYVATTKLGGETILSTFSLVRSSGKLQLLQQATVKNIGAAAQLLRQNDQLLLAGTNGIASMQIDQNGQLGEADMVVAKQGAMSIAVQTV